MTCQNTFPNILLVNLEYADKKVVFVWPLMSDRKLKRTERDLSSASVTFTDQFLPVTFFQILKEKFSWYIPLRQDNLECLARSHNILTLAENIGKICQFCK